MNHKIVWQAHLSNKSLPSSGQPPQTPESQTGQRFGCLDSTTDPAKTGNPIGKPEIESCLLDLIEQIHAAQGGTLDRAAAEQALAAIAAADAQGAGNE